MAVTAACPCQWQQRFRPSAGDCTGSVSAAQNPRKNGEAGCREAGGSMECLGNGWRWRRPSTRCLVGDQRLGASSDRGSVAGGCVAGLISRGSGTCRTARSARCAHAWMTQTWRRQLRVRERCAPRMGPEEEKMTKRSPLDFPAKDGSDFWTLCKRFVHVAAPYWSSDDKTQARTRLAAVFALTLGTTGISVAFNFLGRDFYNALASKDQEQFTRQLLYYLGAFVGGIPVFVMRDYLRDTLALRWRAWMTKHYLGRYFEDRAFYNIQSASLIDNPDQRIVDDVSGFTGTALAFALALFNASIDLISFSGILYGIYPPLFAVLVVYSVGGTAISVALGKGLVGLNFMQEKREADFRYGLVRVRENAESIAFYGGEKNEIYLLLGRFKQSFENYSELLIASRNLDFFTSGYRYLIQLLPAAVVAPLYFSGKIEFGVINQSFSAFNHILSDFSIIVYQFQAISSFSAVIDRLGEFTDLLDKQEEIRRDNSLPAEVFVSSSEDPAEILDRSIITLIDSPYRCAPLVSLSSSMRMTSSQLSSVNGSASTVASEDVDELEMSSRRESQYEASSANSESVRTLQAAPVLLEIENLTLYTPQYSTQLIEHLSVTVREGEHLLIMGPSGSGKTSLLRAIGGLWRAGKGTIRRHISTGVVPSSVSTRTSTFKSESDSDLKNGNGVDVDWHGFSNNTVPAEGLEERGTGQNGEAEEKSEDSSSRGLVFFLPQRPYMVLGNLRQQLLYPNWCSNDGLEAESENPENTDEFVATERENAKDFWETGAQNQFTTAGGAKDWPSDQDLRNVLKRVRLEQLLDRCNGLDSNVDWASVLSLGEQQRLAFARLLLSPARLALMDESTSALDIDNEAHLYTEVKRSGITILSVGHRSSLLKYHTHLLRCERLDKKEMESSRSGLRQAWRLLPIASLSMPAQMEIIQEDEE